MLQPLSGKGESSEDELTSRSVAAEQSSDVLSGSIRGQEFREDFSDPICIERYFHDRVIAIEEEIARLSPQAVLAKLQHCFEHIGKHVRGYEIPMMQSTLALMTANHHCLIGPTGVGKSYYARAVLGVMGSDVTTYQNQLTVETTEHELFGFIPMDRITDGSGCRNLKGSLVLSDVALLDEVFDARDELLRSTLWPLSDRQYRNGNVCVPAALHTVFACGNFARLNPKTEAFLDRFLFQSDVSGLLSPVERQRLLRHPPSNQEVPRLPNEERISLAELAYLPRLVDGAVRDGGAPLPADIRMLLDAIVTTYEANRVAQLGHSDGVVSLRNLKQSGRVVVAHALTQGRTDVTLEDLQCLSLTIPVVGNKLAAEAFNQAWREVMRYAHPGERNALKTLSDLTELVESVEKGIPLRSLTTLEQLLTYFGVTTERRLSFGQLRKAVASLNPSLPYAVAYRDTLLGEIDCYMQRSGRKFDDLLPIR